MLSIRKFTTSSKQWGFELHLINDVIFSVEPPESGEDMLSQVYDKVMNNSSMNGELQDNAVTPMESDMPDGKWYFSLSLSKFPRVW